MYIVNRQKLKQKLDRNELQVVIEVLDPDAYESFHLPNAVNVPFDGNFPERIESVAPDKSRPIAVYSNGGDPDGALRASRKLEEIGYRHVYYYEAGKMDWKEAGLPIETLARSDHTKAIYHPL